MIENAPINGYKDLINDTKISKIKDNLNQICLNYSKLSSADAVKNRETSGYEIYSEQYRRDLIYLQEMCRQAQELINNCNDTMFLINCKAMEYHLFEFGNLEQQ